MRSNTFEELKELVLENYGTGTDASYEALINVIGGKEVIDQYVDMLGDDDEYLLEVDDPDKDLIEQIAIIKANLAYLITSDVRGEMLYNKFSCLGDFYFFMTDLLFTCINTCKNFKFEQLISYLQHLELDSNVIKETVEEIDDDLEAEYFTDSITDAILDDLEEKLIAFDEYHNGHDKVEYEYYNE